MTPQAYIAGSYSSPHAHQIIQHVRAALFGALKASAMGYLPIVPHTMFNHRTTSWEDAMQRCRYLIRQLDPTLDILVLLPGWENSRGAREEVDLAVRLGIRVVALADL